MKLTGSVGRTGAMNNKADVKRVQALLNAALMPAHATATLPTSASALGNIPPFAELKEDGSIGPRTVAAIAFFQKNVVGTKRPDGVVSPTGTTLERLEKLPAGLNIASIIAGATALPKAGSGAALGEIDFAQTAKDLGIEVATIKAVAQVESAGASFIDDGRPVIRFEAHWFSSLTGHFYDGVFPSLSVKKRDDSLVQGGAAGRRREFDRLLDAMALDRESALSSASWGMFQIMGFNSTPAGFNSVDAMVNTMFKTEAEHLRAFASFISKKGYVPYLKDKQWANFAYHYNGEDYGSYDVILEQAYAAIGKAISASAAAKKVSP